MSGVHAPYSCLENLKPELGEGGRKGKITTENGPYNYILRREGRAGVGLE